MRHQQIIIENARTHNLRDVSCRIPHFCLCCVTGVSGSGKSSFAFDTLFVEGQRRYLQSVSTQAKRVVGAIPRPDVSAIHGLTPTVAVAQKTSSGNLRSTVGTTTEIYDYLRLLFARLAIPHCPISGEPLIAQTKNEIVDHVFSEFAGNHVYILAPYIRQKKGTLKEEFADIERKGYVRVRVDGRIIRVSEDAELSSSAAHDLDVLIDSVLIKPEHKRRVTESIHAALQMGKGNLEIADKTSGQTTFFSEHAYSKTSNLYYPQLEPHLFSFNSPEGMCENCQGLGQEQLFFLDKIIDESKSIEKDCCSIAGSYSSSFYRNVYDNLASLYNFSVSSPWKELPDEAKRVLLYGTEKKWTRMSFIDPKTGAVSLELVQWRGIITEAKTRYHNAKSLHYKRKMEALMQQTTCQQCHGSRLKPYPSAARLFGKTIQDVCTLSIHELASLFSNTVLPKHQHFAEECLQQTIARLKFLDNVGLGYLTLDRTTPTLSGGEFQRVQLGAHIGGGLSGITYVLDEPSIGLHPQDNEKLINSLHQLKEKGNTVVVVEHDPQTIRAADWIVDFGPGAGELGGRLMYQGSLGQFAQCSSSLTASYLSGKLTVERRHAPRPPSHYYVTLTGATLHNLQDVTIRLPLGRFVAITGVSGSGKSSLILETLYPALSSLLMRTQFQGGKFASLEGVEHLQSIMHIDQSPIGRTPRSNPATYSGLFHDIRDLFASLPESRARGWTTGRFSFNVSEGTCVVCSGMGMVPVNMDFLEEVWATCEECKGKRFDEETLSVHYKNKNIYDVLEMTCHEALEHFSSIPSIRRRLETLCRIGLDYIRLGQPATTISGGEAQRLKIAKELARPSTGKTLYVLDEPTTGLHSHDLAKLLDVLHELVDRGNSVVVIEHNMELIKTADWVIDMGPGSGNDGGKIIAEADPATLSTLSTPTGKALRDSSTVRQEQTARKRAVAASRSIEVVGAQQNNLKNIHLHLPKNKLTVVIGPSGAGKSSLAIETLFAEGQRRYIETLSTYARQFVRQMPRPRVDHIDNLSPTVAIEQRRYASSPRSTLGTISEIYDYLRIFWSKVGIPHCPKTGAIIRSITKERVADILLSKSENLMAHLLAFYPVLNPSAFQNIIQKLRTAGYVRFRIQDRMYNLDIENTPKIPPGTKIKLEVVVDRVRIAPSQRGRLLESISTAAKLGNGSFTVVTESEERYFNLSFAVEETGESFPPISAQTFSFSHPQGMCPECRGGGSLLHVDVLSQSQTTSKVGNLLANWIDDTWLSDSPLFSLEDAMAHFGVDPQTPLSSVTTAQKKRILYGDPSPILIGDTPFSVEWLGVQTVFDTLLNHPSKDLEEMARCLDDLEIGGTATMCPACQGSRLNALAQNVTIDGVSIAQFCNMPISEASLWFLKIISKNQDPSVKFVAEEICNRLATANDLGLGYATLSRSAASLSGGEAQRARLVSQIGTDLSGILYVFDEPTVGLHPHDQQKLFAVLRRLQDQENTLLMIEHDPQAIQVADHVIELGPEGGIQGGAITFQGSRKKFWENGSSITRPILNTPVTPRPPQRFSSFLEIQNVSCHNLTNFSCSIPINAVVGVIGVCGSGKSTLVFDVIGAAAEGRQLTRTVLGLEKFRHCVVVDQKPLGQASRSDVSSFMELSSSFRKFYADLPAAKERGLDATHFSTRLSRGMCRRCGGFGYRRIDMYFLPPVKVLCDECHGLRLNAVSLAVEFQGKNFGHLLQLTVGEAKELFRHEPKIAKILDSLIELGLHYLLLGQELSSLSGGEVQRMKIAREVTKGRRHKTLYLMDEPTTGLHAREVQALIQLLHTLRDEGHTVIVVEHNMHLAITCDHLIELGPSAGDKGGRVIAQGSTHDVLNNPASITAPYMRPFLTTKRSP